MIVLKSTKKKFKNSYNLLKINNINKILRYAIDNILVFTFYKW